MYINYIKIGKKLKSIYNNMIKFMITNGAKFRNFQEKFITDSNRNVIATQLIKVTHYNNVFFLERRDNC